MPQRHHLLIEVTMEEKHTEEVLISVNGRSLQSLGDFWTSLENCSNSSEDKSEEIESVALKNAGMSGQRCCRRLSTALVTSSKSVDTNVLRSIHMEDAKIGPRGVKILAEELLSQCAGLSILNLSGCRMGHFGAQALVDNNFPSESLTKLILKGNNLGDDGVWKLTSGLFSKLTRLEELDLSKNSISDNSLGEIGRCLPTMRSLMVLRLTENNIKAMSIEGLITGVETTEESKLVELDLSKNQIEASGAVQLAKLLCVASSALEILNVSHNLIGDEGAMTLAEALKSDKVDSRLKELDLTHNEIGDSGAGCLVDLLDTINGTTTEQPFMLELIKGNPGISPARIKIFDMLRKHHEIRRQRSSIQPIPLAEAPKSLEDSMPSLDETTESETIISLRKEIVALKLKMESMEKNMEKRILEIEQKSVEERKEYHRLIESLRKEFVLITQSMH